MSIPQYKYNIKEKKPTQDNESNTQRTTAPTNSTTDKKKTAGQRAVELYKAGTPADAISQHGRRSPEYKLFRQSLNTIKSRGRAGRDYKYTPEEITEKIESYVEYCENEGLKLTRQGFQLWSGVSGESFYNMQRHEHFKPIFEAFTNYMQEKHHQKLEKASNNDKLSSGCASLLQFQAQVAGIDKPQQDTNININLQVKYSKKDFEALGSIAGQFQEVENNQKSIEAGQCDGESDDVMFEENVEGLC
jgi:hypothetical protein